MVKWVGAYCMGRRIYPVTRGWSFLWDQSMEGRCSDRSVRCWKGQTKFLCASWKRRSGEGAIAVRTKDHQWGWRRATIGHRTCQAWGWGLIMHKHCAPGFNSPSKLSQGQWVCSSCYSSVWNKERTRRRCQNDCVSDVPAGAQAVGTWNQVVLAVLGRKEVV